MKVLTLLLLAIIGRSLTYAPEPAPRFGPEAEASVPSSDRFGIADTLWSGCSFRGISLHGKVKVVTAFPDIKVQVVDAFPDIAVKWVTAFPDDCGKWKKVDAFPDFKIQFVDAFPDIKIQVVDAFPGMRRGG